jgi:hypothetical protein
VFMRTIILKNKPSAVTFKLSVATQSFSASMHPRAECKIQDCDAFTTGLYN